jgi:hypothetical protein
MFMQGATAGQYVLMLTRNCAISELSLTVAEYARGKEG